MSLQRLQSTLGTAYAFFRGRMWRADELRLVGILGVVSWMVMKARNTMPSTAIGTPQKSAVTLFRRV
jgi:predicted alpha/beta hydrolase